jgi:hypothetical protein
MFYNRIRTFVIFCAFFSFSITSIPIARSAPIHEFNEFAAVAYGFYREAFFLLRTGNPLVASIELEKMSFKWKNIIKKYGPTPPDIYSKDQQWEFTLEKINEKISDGLELTINGETKKAISVLRPVRKLLSSLRKRNGVYIYSDTIDQANAAFKRLKKFRYNPPNFNVVEEVDQLRQSLATTVFWYKQCVKNAPDSLRENPEFKRLMEESLYSLSRVWVAIANKKETNLISILRGLSSSDQMLFLRFG